MEDGAMQGMSDGTSVLDTFQVLLVADALGIIIGLISIRIIWKVARKLGGRIRKPLILFTVGLGLMVVSFAVTIGIFALGTMTPTTMAVHHYMMVFGMIFFVLAGKSLLSFIKI